jgi:hypothetical protein
LDALPDFFFTLFLKDFHGYARGAILSEKKKEKKRKTGFGTLWRRGCIGVATHVEVAWLR